MCFDRVGGSEPMRDHNCIIPYSGKNWRALYLANWPKMAVIGYWRNLNLAI